MFERLIGAESLELAVGRARAAGSRGAARRRAQVRAPGAGLERPEPRSRPGEPRRPREHGRRRRRSRTCSVPARCMRRQRRRAAGARAGTGHRQQVRLGAVRLALDVDAVPRAPRPRSRQPSAPTATRSRTGGATTRTTSPPSATTIEVARGRASGPRPARPPANATQASGRSAKPCAWPHHHCRRMPARAPVLLGVGGRAVEGERVRPGHSAAPDARAEQVAGASTG